VLVRALVGHSLQISPPFVIAEDEIELLADRIRDVLEREAAALPTGVAA
jgi:adenosylmethionine-8-amino-7-oxononanoate aminotransferase